MQRPLQLDEVLASARYFPHRFDPASDRVLYVPADPATLDRAAFLDGRTPFAAGDEIVVDMADALAWFRRSPAAAAPAMIFHSAFCGSTLLARACSVPGHTLALKEPQILLDLASWRAGLPHATTAYRDRLGFVLAQIGRPHAAEAIVVKPSNWANNILADILAIGGGKAVILSGSLRGFMTAVLRGGRDRIAFTCRFAAHIARARPDFAPDLEQAAHGGTAMERAARLIALAFAMQQRLFDEAGTRFGDRLARLRFDALLGTPEAAVAQASAALDLRLTATQRAEAIARTFARHAKDATLSFDARESAAANDAVMQTYAPLIEMAEQWVADRPASR